jgi:hypothetical protein
MVHRDALALSGSRSSTAVEAIYFRPGSQPEAAVRKVWAEQAVSS